MSEPMGRTYDLGEGQTLTVTLTDEGQIARSLPIPILTSRSTCRTHRPDIDLIDGIDYQ